MTAPGKIILLNGASSSGKSTLSHAVQATIPQPFWHVSFDHLKDSGVLPMARMRKDFDWATVREGVFEGLDRSLAAYATAGNNLIVEHIVETPARLERLVELLSPFDVFFVGLHCDVEELERRERARGDPRLGDARRDAESIHGYSAYDLELDSREPAAANAERLIAAWEARRRPGVFDRLAAR